MIKGCRRKMIIVSGLKDSSFEAAYFVLKDSEKESGISENDILKKANQIIDNSLATEKNSPSGRKLLSGSSEKNASTGKISSLCFLLGFFAGGIIWAAIVALIFLI